jgi:hypothetical protein
MLTGRSKQGQLLIEFAECAGHGIDAREFGTLVTLATGYSRAYSNLLKRYPERSAIPPSNVVAIVRYVAL